MTAVAVPDDAVDTAIGAYDAVCYDPHRPATRVDAMRAALESFAASAAPGLTTVAAPAGADPLAGLKPLISVEKAAEVLGFSRATAYRYAKAGELPCRRVDGRVYVITAGLRALLTPGPAPGAEARPGLDARPDLDAAVLRIAADRLEVDPDDASALALVGDVPVAVVCSAELAPRETRADVDYDRVQLMVGASLAADLRMGSTPMMTALCWLPGPLRASAAAAWAYAAWAYARADR
jgi:excisionase family DNA binding protein